MKKNKREIVNFDNFIYKFKALDNLDHVLDIIENDRLYLPDYFELNDVFECPNSTPIPLTAGFSISLSIGKLPMDSINLLSRYRILSLTDNPKNPVMWAHYSKNYSGICLMFNKGAFGKLTKVSYVEPSSKLITDANHDLEDIVFEGLTRKQAFWSYESEYRKILKTEQKFYNFENELVGIIFGHNYKENIRLEQAIDKKKVKTV